jgi:deoxyribodipyrimidine photo-lyase
MKTTVVWFHSDLRVADNPALHAAAQRGAVVPVFVYAPEEQGERAPGAARQWWLHHSLEALNQSLQRLGARLVLRRATQSLPALEQILAETGADALYWNTRYEPQLWERDERVHKTLRARGIETREFPSYLLHDPNAVRTDAGQPYTVFTPFWKRMLQVVEVPDPLPAPETLRTPERMPASEPLEALGLLPTIDWAAGFRATWQVGEAAAHRRLEWFLRNAVEDYHTLRDRPDLDATSRLSPHLQHGEITPRQIWHATLRHSRGKWTKGVEHFLREVGWREFAYHILYHHPYTQTRALRSEFDSFPWTEVADARLQSVDARAHGHPDGGRGHAPAVAHRLDAQPHAHDCRLVADQKPAAPLALRRGVVLGHAGGRRPRKQCVGLAVDGGLRGGRRALLPHLQRRHSRAQVRPRRRVCAPVGS